MAGHAPVAEPDTDLSLDLELLDQLDRVAASAGTRLVLHGGSSIRPSDLPRLERFGVARVDFGGRPFARFLNAINGLADEGAVVSPRGPSDPQSLLRRARALTSIVVSGMGAGAMPGVAVGVWAPGQGSFVRAFGTSSLATGRPLRLDDHFRIASISESFTATTILRLADQHRLSLDDPLSKYIPGIQNGDRITVAQLLDMTSGVYDYVNDHAVLRAYAHNPLRPLSLHDVVAIIKRHKPLFDPGKESSTTTATTTCSGRSRRR